MAALKQEEVVNDLVYSQDSDVAVVQEHKVTPANVYADQSTAAIGFLEAAYCKLKVRVQDHAKEREKSLEWLDEICDRLDNVSLSLS